MPINRRYENLAELPAVAPVFPLSGVLLLPRGELPLNVFEPRYVAMIDAAMKTNRLIGMVQIAGSQDPGARKPDLARTGCLGRITQLGETGDGRYILNLTGIVRFRILEELPVMTPYRQCRLGLDDYERDLSRDPTLNSVNRAELLQCLQTYAAAKDLKVDWSGLKDAPPGAVITMFSMMLPFDALEKQALLEAESMADRVRLLIAMTDPAKAASDDTPKTLH